MKMAVVKLKAGETVIVTAINADLKPDNTLPGQQPRPDQGLPTPPDQANDPWYGIDLGLGYVRPDQSLPGVEKPVDPGYGIDEDTGWVHPDNTLPPPEIPADPNYDIDQILGFLRPDNTLPIPPDEKPDGPHWEVKIAWTPVTGWVVVAIPGEGSLVPTPSKGKR
jgi:hypothetical protein